MVVDLFDGVFEVPGGGAHIDFFAHAPEHLLLDGFEADQKGLGAAVGGRLQQPVVFDDIQTGLAAPFLAGVLQLFKKTKGPVDTVSAGTDDVVIDNKEPLVGDGVDLGDDVIDLAHPVLAAVEPGHRTELAVVGAAPRGLNGLDEILVGQQLAAGGRQIADVRPFFGPVEFLQPAGGKIPQQLRP